MAHITEISTERYQHESWLVTATKSHILPSRCSTPQLCNASVENSCPFCKYEQGLELPQLPEMTFANNTLTLEHEKGFSIEFNAFDALKLVDSKNDSLKVAIAEAWQESRMENSQIKNVVKPFDWTYSTEYKGSLLGNTDLLKISAANERIDIEKLKSTSKILFYADVVLFEDELADNGTAQISVKIRMMSDYFFILMRYFLRVDRLLVRIIDTRIYHEFKNNFMLREHVTKESKVKDLNVDLNVRNPQDLWDHLPTVLSECERIEF